MSPQTSLKVFDLHCDTLDRLLANRASSGLSPQVQEMFDPEIECGVDDAAAPTLASNTMDISLDNMLGYQWCQCFGVFLPDFFKPDEAWNLYTQVRALFQEQMEKNPGRLAQVRGAGEIDAALAADKCAALLTIEGGTFFDGSLPPARALAPVDELAADGVQMLTLTWNAANAIAAGSQSAGGLTAFGRELVRALEERRIVVDVSHLNDESFFDVAAAATRPFAASHSNSRAVCDHPRNLTDDQFRVICEHGGIVGLNYCNDFLTTSGRAAEPDEVLAHIEHWLELGGQRNIALGSDYDGAYVPGWLRPCHKINALYGHVAAAFGQAIAEGLFFENARRFFGENQLPYECDSTQ